MRTAQLISKIAWGINPSEVQKEHRTQAKAVVFGTLYGMEAKTLAGRLHCTIKEAEKIMGAVMGRFHELRDWIRLQLHHARKTGVTWTWWDGQKARCRSLHNIADHDDHKRSIAEHSAHNTTIQGTASEFCLASVGAIVQWILEEEIPAKLVATVHDSIVLEVQNDYVDEVAYAARQIMIGWNSLDVDLEVDIEVGPSWGSLKPYALAA